ncbi:hexuronate transporter [Sphingomonas sp. Leaf24]|uniref:MFS transporter n=1 Tax=unclassified Sphingomonas TaxID=196159 RepID=UPI0006FC947C|nr:MULTISPECIES: MFS transporter [unclassified Sphingomonas]KQM20224.1 hexuronate transporter [Sphingomonas sp. Leaf5]KQM76048.1 hexuronate transporter [Sphingomonas sp. Leaf22]KQM89487.1 hexuronate transporter [Sphingomonas sp. Leaf24]
MGVVTDAARQAPETAAIAVPRPRGRVRWVICALLFVAVILSYIDRLVLGVLKPQLAELYGWTNAGYGDVTGYFQVFYGIGFLLFGWLIDRIGPKYGYLLAMGSWTLGHFAQTLATSTTGFVIARIPLAFGEAGTYPSALAAASQWFPRKERALAIGIFNAGANVGAVVTPLLIGFIVTGMLLDWRWAFIITGMFNLVWLFAWWRLYHKPADHPTLTREERAWIDVEPQQDHGRAGFLQVLRHREAWSYMAGRFLIDPVWWTFLFWLPDFFNKTYGYDLKRFGPPLVAIYILADLGAIAGGWYSSHLLKRGVSTGAARKRAMFVCALFALPVMFAGQASNIWIAVTLIGLACAAHQGFSTNLFALPGDQFPRFGQGTLIGLGGFAGAVGGFIASKSLGILLDTIGSYGPFFVACGVAYLVALLVFHLLNPTYRKVELRADD